MTDRKGKHYFASDGNYGDAKDIVIVDTSNWSEEDWERFEFVAENDRIAYALSVNRDQKQD